MNVIGLFLLLFAVVAVAMGLFLIAGSTNVVPVDSYGNTVSNATNMSIGNSTSVMMAGNSAIPWVAFIIAVLIVVAVFLWAIGYSGVSKSRYN